jgi:hypothetical protein
MQQATAASSKHQGTASSQNKNLKSQHKLLEPTLLALANQKTKGFSAIFRHLSSFWAAIAMRIAACYAHIKMLPHEATYQPQYAPYFTRRLARKSEKNPQPAATNPVPALRLG